jgi:hypothetical protein
MAARGRSGAERILLDALRTALDRLAARRRVTLCRRLPTLPSSAVKLPAASWTVAISVLAARVRVGEMPLSRLAIDETKDVVPSVVANLGSHQKEVPPPVVASPSSAEAARSKSTYRVAINWDSSSEALLLKTKARAMLQCDGVHDMTTASLQLRL